MHRFFLAEISKQMQLFSTLPAISVNSKIKCFKTLLTVHKNNYCQQLWIMLGYYIKRKNWWIFGYYSLTNRKSKEQVTSSFATRGPCHKLLWRIFRLKYLLMQIWALLYAAIRCAYKALPVNNARLARHASRARGHK